MLEVSPAGRKRIGKQIENEVRDARCLLRVERTRPRGVAASRDVETPQPGRGEVRVRLLTSGVNPSDVKSRAGLTRKIAFPRVIPHSDGAGEIDAVGEGVSPARVGERVWVWNGQWRRPFGTAAEWIVLPSEQAVPLPANVSMDAGACLGIPAYTGYQAVLLAGARKAPPCWSPPAPAPWAITPSSLRSSARPPSSPP